MAARFTFPKKAPTVPTVNSIDENRSAVISDPNSHPDFIVDALFGTGSRDLLKDAFAASHRSKSIASNPIHNAKRKSLPSTFHRACLPIRESPIGPHVKADLTVTFTAPKIGNVLPPNCHANGELDRRRDWHAGLFNRRRILFSLELVERKEIADWLQEPRRRHDAHKGSVGDVLFIAGSRGKTGAAALAAKRRCAQAQDS